jgi:hypothetical protein
MRFLPLLDNKDYHQRNKRQQKEVFQTWSVQLKTTKRTCYITYTKDQSNKVKRHWDADSYHEDTLEARRKDGDV